MHDLEAVSRYRRVLECIRAHGMEPNVTLWHFVHPTWFEEAGGWAQEDNVPAFVDYARRCFEWFGPQVKLWATLNEPTCYAFVGHVLGVGPPGRLLDLAGAGRVLSSLLRAHSAAYAAIKALPGGADAQVGLVNHHLSFEPLGKGVLYLLAKLASDWLSYLWGWDVMERWLLTGRFEWAPVPGVRLSWEHPSGRPPCDWWGINYYTSACVCSWSLQSACRPGQRMTDMGYPLSAEGMYRCIKRCSTYGMPLYVTETGVADARDDQRAAMIQSYMAAVLRAMEEGCDVRGVYYWTLVDSLEWCLGYTMKFGLYAWEPDGSVDRVLREGSKALVRFFAALPDSLQAARQAARQVRTLLLRQRDPAGGEQQEQARGPQAATQAGAGAGARAGVGASSRRGAGVGGRTGEQVVAQLLRLALEGLMALLRGWRAAGTGRAASAAA
ncbi:hypothetical protein HYH03_004360 [Edaphochlamys debaryana]|uniref:Beta-glucosidase n=1 Tax=Edaphochlamys debaryana TaxID=47281 RepID=A0A835YB70_9CHLO|nr:hypothetical protein HYH03_004360 [Edaphochlamys debaryana]|eukprot:KAG2497616.1 hypothetical protein HYH03_004360 [Edaphochlamys debaryana]